MSDVKRYICDNDASFEVTAQYMIDQALESEDVYVLASDYDSLAIRCKELREALERVISQNENAKYAWDTVKTIARAALGDAP